MDASKRIQKNISLFLLYTYLVLFPFGQLLKLGELRNYGNLVDVVVLFFVIFYLNPWVAKPKIDKEVRYFLVASVFSLLFSLFFLNMDQVFYGSLYLLRIFSYYSFGVVVRSLIIKKEISGIKLLKLLIFSLLATGLIGWVQYLIIPDLRLLKYMGWDDHLNRLAGSFFDPGFTGILFALSALVLIYLYKLHKSFVYIPLFCFFVVSILFTYSRASYLALIMGLIVYFYKKMHTLKIIFASLVIIILLVLKLSTASGEGTKLLRTSTIHARLASYSQTVDIIKKNPVFGVGFNNLCQTKVSEYSEKRDSHSCGGSDSSILFIIATTGLIGFLIFLNLLYKSLVGVNPKHKRFIFGIFVSLLVHSLFVQSLFYPFVMGFLAISIPSVLRLKE